MYDPPDSDEDYLQGKEQERVEKLDAGVALAEKKDPEELIELKASITKAQFMEVITERAIERLFGRYGNETLEHEVRKHIHAVAERQARDVINRVLEEEVAKATQAILAEGFQGTDSYGRPKGERKTVASYVLEYFTTVVNQWGEESRTHDRDSKQRIFRSADKLVEEYLKKEIEPELAKLKQRCKDAMNTDVVGKIRESLMSGLGLKS